MYTSNVKYLILFALFFVSAFSSNAFSQSVLLKWKDNPGQGKILLNQGKIEKMKVFGSGKCVNGNFSFAHQNKYELSLTVGEAKNEKGPYATVVTVCLEDNATSFSFFLRDVSKDYPIYLDRYGVVVLPDGDKRDFQQVENMILADRKRTKLQEIEAQPEMSFEKATSIVRKMDVPIWLGLSRDMRLFEVEDELETNNLECKAIRPRYAGSPRTLAESNNQGVWYRYALGRGVGVRNNITRYLEHNSLPIYHSVMQDDDVKYHTITFTSLEKQELKAENVKGTDYFVSDRYSPGRVFTPEQKIVLEKKLSEYSENTEEVILFSKTYIENKGNVPRYAWIKAPQTGNGNWKYKFNPLTGYSAFSTDKVFCVSKLSGEPMPNEEVAVLLKPGESLEFEFYLPHSPISDLRATELAQVSFEDKYQECIRYWEKKLADAAQISVPEDRINHMIKAGLLHLDLITFGQNPNGTLAANVGIYSPIGTESSPIIQFYMSMGWMSEAKRALSYFLETQQESGLIANYSGYMVETGAVLWNIGEYYRYTRDAEWIKSILPNLKKACSYLIEWRNNNKKDELVGKGYGMIDGKVADPEDNFHQFMLNGYAYLGLSRIGEIFKNLGMKDGDSLLKEANLWKQDIRKSLKASMALSPVIPLGDGTWSPTAPPWAEGRGPRALCQDLGSFWSHGTFTIADGLLGPLYLVFCEVLTPDEPIADMLYRYHSELFYQDNSGFSQPYYSTHNWLQAKRGLVKPFLNTYYTTMAAVSDRSTYTFWEHMYKMTLHKTHEEANFLMDTRRMLYMEKGDTLELFKVIPRKWLQDGKEIRLNNVQSYFGGLKVSAKSLLDSKKIEAYVECTSDRKPSCIEIRLPHPEYSKAVSVEGGKYDPQTETVIVTGFTGKATIKLQY